MSQNYISRVEKFISQKTALKKLIVIYGPTGSGKTEMSIDIAKYLDTEIISTDSRQIFKYMDIGTGKITEDEKKWVPHHMLDIVTPDQKFSMGDFVRKSQVIMDELWNHNKIPMLVWGTGLYIDSLIFERNSADVSSDPELRRYLDTLSNEQLYQKLMAIDSEYANELHPNNRPYVERGIEIKTLTWKSKMEFRAPKYLRYDVLFLTPESPNGMVYREWLYDRINNRVEQMFDQWAERELLELIEKWYNFTDFWLNSIWYREFQRYFSWEIGKKELISHIQQNSRNYAKRQLTWFKKYEKYQVS